jgi:hypothetical protein
MQAWSRRAVGRRLLVAMALAALGPLALAQDVAPSPDKPLWVQSIPIWLPSLEWAAWAYDPATVERLFGETEEPTRGYDTKRVKTIRIRVEGYAPARRLWEPGTVGGFWDSRDLQQLFGR